MRSSLVIDDEDYLIIV